RPSAGPSRPPIAPPHASTTCSWSGSPCQSIVSSPPSVYISTWRRRSVTSTSCAASACSAFSGDSGSATPGTLPATVPNRFGTLTPLADVAQLVEHHLAKVRVAGSSPVVRSTQPDTRRREGPEPGRNGPRGRPRNTQQGPQNPVPEAQAATERPRREACLARTW